MLNSEIRSIWVRGAALLFAVLLLGLFVWGGNQPQAAGAVSPPWDKLAHLAWFATLAGLLRLGLPAMGMRGVLGLALACLGVGLWDEWRQLALPGRHFGLDDLLADAAGIALGLLLAARAQRAQSQ